MMTKKHHSVMTSKRFIDTTPGPGSAGEVEGANTPHMRHGIGVPAFGELVGRGPVAGTLHDFAAEELEAATLATPPKT